MRDSCQHMEAAAARSSRAGSTTRPAWAPSRRRASEARVPPTRGVTGLTSRSSSTPASRLLPVTDTVSALRSQDVTTNRPNCWVHRRLVRGEVTVADTCRTCP